MTRLVEILYILHCDEECLQLVTTLLQKDPHNGIASLLSQRIQNEKCLHLLYLQPEDIPVYPTISKKRKRMDAMDILRKSRFRKTLPIEKKKEEFHVELKEGTWKALGELLLTVFEMQNTKMRFIPIVVDLSLPPIVVIEPIEEGVVVSSLGDDSIKRTLKATEIIDVTSDADEEAPKEQLR